MKKIAKLAPRFVEFIPDVIEEGVLYVSMEHETVIHKCCCGCGSEVVTPLSPTDWQLTYDGVSITLYPSIGNWGFPCKSHYWIRGNSVRWAQRWSHEEIAAGRAADQLAKEHYYANSAPPINDRSDGPATGEHKGSVDPGILRRLLRRWTFRKP
jgi:hypothetical protein